MPSNLSKSLYVTIKQTEKNNVSPKEPKEYPEPAGNMSLLPEFWYIFFLICMFQVSLLKTTKLLKTLTFHTIIKCRIIEYPMELWQWLIYSLMFSLFWFFVLFFVNNLYTKLWRNYLFKVNKNRKTKTMRWNVLVHTVNIN